MLFVILAIVVVLALYFVSTQRKFISFDEINQNALSQIGVQQNARWNALSQLVNAARSYAEIEKETLSEIVSQRVPITMDSTAEQVNQQENVLSQAMSRLIAVAENYPELKASGLYEKAMDSINTYENDVRMSKMVFNDTVTKWNRLVRQFPSSIVAGILGFSSKTYLETPEEKQAYPDLQFK
ncbi:MAG: LemA family protein [Tissierellia bacterium]|nr:LemA family protein [Tissierellia bacterium]